MIRFVPDTWRDAILRPIALASSDGGVYVEIMAPDFRFLFALMLALAWIALTRRAQREAAPAVVLLGFTAIAFVPWLATTGNGRYFIPFLLIVGPLCVGLLHLVPASRGFRVVTALGMVLWHGYLIYEIDPWSSWGLAKWGDGPAFEVAIPEEVARQPATYVTLSSISYSLIAPKFHPASRWINIATVQGVADRTREGIRARSLLAAPGALKVLFPTYRGAPEGGRIDPELGRAIDDLLARQDLSIEDEGRCRVLPSAGLAATYSRRLDPAERTETNVHGFWLCPLARHASSRARTADPVSSWIEQTFQKLETLCPRIFRPGEAVSLRIPSGAVRGYPGSDFKLYVLDDGRVVYKYYRALNPVDVGLADDILAPGFTMQCNDIRGRSGLPWERKL